MRHWLAVGAAFVWCLVTRSASAAPTGEELAVARGLFEQARAAERKEQWTECQGLVKEALRILETPGLLFHLAYCREQQGEWVDALAAYERAKELVDAGMVAPDLQPLLESALNGLRVRLPRVRLSPSQTRVECELKIDGKMQSSVLTHQAIPLDPGKHRLEMQCDGYVPFSREIELVPGEAPSLAVRLTPVAGEAPPGPAPHSAQAAAISRRAPNSDVEESKRVAGEQSENGSGFRAKHGVMIGAGALAVAGVVTGIVFHRMAELDYRRILERQAEVGKTLREPCSTNSTQVGCPQLLQQESNYKAERALEVVSFAVGGASGIAALLTGLLAGGSPSNSSQSATASPGLPVTMQVSATSKVNLLPRLTASFRGNPKLMFWLEGSF